MFCGGPICSRMPGRPRPCRRSAIFGASTTGTAIATNLRGHGSTTVWDGACALALPAGRWRRHGSGIGWTSRDWRPCWPADSPRPRLAGRGEWCSAAPSRRRPPRPIRQHHAAAPDSATWVAADGMICPRYALAARRRQDIWPPGRCADQRGRNAGTIATTAGANVAVCGENVFSVPFRLAPMPRHI